MKLGQVKDKLTTNIKHVKNFEFLIIKFKCRKKNVHLFYAVFDKRGFCVVFNFSGFLNYKDDKILIYFHEKISKNSKNFIFISFNISIV